MEKIYTKISETEIGVIDATPIVVSLEELKYKERAKMNEIDNIQADLDRIREQIAQAESLGIKERVAVGIIE